VGFWHRSGKYLYDLDVLELTLLAQMVKVATSLDVPIKLLWPKSLDFSSARGYTMLGLGDIVVPGTFIALALRYDHHRFLSAPSPKAKFEKPYFYASFIAYIVGLATCMTVMHVFKAAQPALLYLRYVPRPYDRRAARVPKAPMTVPRAFYHSSSSL
jgi:minor histocompatibility antigen H13